MAKGRKPTIKKTSDTGAEKPTRRTRRTTSKTGTGSPRSTAKKTTTKRTTAKKTTAKKTPVKKTDPSGKKQNWTGRIHEHPNAGKGNFAVNPQNAGRKPSIKKAINKMLSAEGTMAIPKKSLIREDDNNWYVKIPTTDSIAMQLMRWAMGSNGSHSLRAIEMMMERTDGLVLREKDVQDLTEVLNRYVIVDDHAQHTPPIQSEKAAIEAAEDIDFEELADTE